MYKEFTVFDIPIYLMSESEYNQKISEDCEKASKKIVCSENVFLGEKTHCITNIKKNFPWRYNQLVGALRIAISNEESIELRLYFVDKMKIRYNSREKHVIKECYIPDLRLKKDLQFSTDEELKKSLKKKIDFIIDNYVNNGSHKYFVDTEVFDNLLCHIDLLNLVAEMNS